MAVGENANENAPEQSGPKWRLPVRYLMAIMGSIGLAIIYGFKVNVSVAIVAMVNRSALQQENLNENQSLAPDVCGFSNENDTAKNSEDGPFVWNEPLQGFILSAYFWGYMVSLIPGGRMAELLSAKWVMNGSVLLNVFASVLSPLAAELHYSLFMLMRFLQGIGGGVTFPAMHVMVSKWAPPDERSVLVSIVYAGTALGTVISILLSGMLAAQLGWVWVFYIEGGLCLIWCTAWWLMIEDSPEQQQRFITQAEKNYILDSLGQKRNDIHAEKPPVPWRQIFTSLPFLAIVVAHFCSNFGWYMLLIELPTFMNQILKFQMSSNAGLSSLPFFCMWLFTMILSKSLSILQDKQVISVTLSRKIGTWIASGIPALCLVGVSFVGCNRGLAVTFMTIGVTCIGGMYCGFLANHIDIAPNFAGTLVAITNCIATIPGFLVPIFVGKLTEGNQTIEAWRIIFLTTVGLYAVLIIVYTTFASGEEQPWNRVKSKDEEMASDQTLPLKEST